MLTPEEKRDRLARWLKVGAVLGGAVIIAPIIFMAVQGLIGLALALAVGFTINALAPVFALRVATWRIMGLKAIARGNPIETREHIAIQNRERLKQFAESITSFAAEVKNFADEVAKLERQYPGESASFQEQLAACRHLLQVQRDKYAAATKAAEEFEAATARAKAKWNVAQSALRMRRLAGAQMGATMDKILAEEALDSVQSAMNSAFAELETSIMEATSTLGAITHNPTEPLVIEAHATVKEVVR